VVGQVVADAGEAADALIFPAYHQPISSETISATETV
jgi:hypothetical protein